jgi:cytosine/adenosine deaminase-related metal-dependent hydrolase
MSDTTCIRNADWVVAWDEGAARHGFLRGADVAFLGEEIVHVGPAYEGEVDNEIDGRDLVVMPGLVNVHSHPMSEPMNKGVTDEMGSRRLGMSGLYEYMPAFRPDAEGTAACAELAYAELLKSGVTTLVDLSVPWDGWIELMARSGLRGVLAPMYRSARWFTANGYTVEYEWDEKAGREAFDAALSLIERARQDPSGRLDGMLTPSQIDTCTEELLRDSAAVAKERNLSLQIHASQSVVEFNEMTRRHGITPIQWLEKIGFLGPGATVAHCIFVDHHSWVRWPTRRDRDILVETGTSVAHCPTVFVRRGILLQNFGDYAKAGINVGLGTDTFPHNFLEELRTAATLSRVAAEDVAVLGTGDALHAATIGGANILQRDDIGRLAPGAKADVVLIDARHPAMQPLRDPLRSLVYAAAERAVSDVYVGGRKVVAGGEVLTLDHAGAAAKVTEAQRRAEARVPEVDYAGRRHDELVPLSLPTL